MVILGIETSCDETAAAVVKDGHKLISNVVASSIDLHSKYGGVVPEIAARAQMEYIIPTIEKSLEEAFSVLSPESLVLSKKLPATDYQLPANVWDQIDAIAVTQGPGLGGSLLVGVMTARTLAITKNKPLYAVNHVQAHPYAAFITEVDSRRLTVDSLQMPGAVPHFPVLALIVSGGHTQLVLFKSHSDYKVLGRTSDDAVGEAYDKVAKMLGLPYPGGPSVGQKAMHGNPQAIKLPKAKMDNPYNFSFSGLKTAVLRASQHLAGKDYTFPSTALPEALNESQKADIAASFQYTAINTLVDALEEATKQFSPASVVVAGGVAASPALRAEISQRLKVPVVYPDMKLCTDNAAMIASLAYFLATTGQQPADPHKLSPDTNLKM